MVGASNPGAGEAMISLGEVLARPEAFAHGDALYMAPGDTFQLGDPCVVHDVDDVVNEDVDVPAVAAERGFDYIVDIQTVREVVENTRMQMPDPSAAQVLTAFVFYYRRDAFIDWSTHAVDASNED